MRTIKRTIDSAQPIGQFLLFKNSSVIKFPIKTCLAPPKRSGMTYSPRAGIKTKLKAFTSGIFKLGIKILVNI